MKPNKILMVVDKEKERKTLVRLLPFLKGLTQIQGKPTAYVCINYTCELPTNNLEVLRKILDGTK